MYKKVMVITGVLMLIIAVVLIMIPSTTETAVKIVNPAYVPDPRLHTASFTYINAQGDEDRGLMMTQDTFDFMCMGHTDAEKIQMQSVVTQMEKNYTRHYVIKTALVDYTIENGVLVGSTNHE
jgi:hypothetical protein